jgi:ACS family sodium-dependent inorganic phosphate cotransporter
MAQDFGWTDTNKGMILSAFYFGYFLVNIPAGFLADRFGGKRVMSVGCFLWSLFTILTPLVSRSYPLLLVMRVLLGITEGLCWPAAHTLMAKWFPEAEISRFVQVEVDLNFLDIVHAPQHPFFLSTFLSTSMNLSMMMSNHESFVS